MTKLSDSIKYIVHFIIQELSFPCNPGNSCCLCDKALDTVCCGREPDCNTDFNWEAQYLTPQCPPATFYSPFIWWEALWCLFVILPTLCCCLSPRLRQHFCRCHHSTRRDPACSISSIDLPPLPTYAEVTQKPPNYDAAVLDSLPSYQEAIDNQQNQSATNCQLVLDINESNNSIERSNLNITANSNG